ncbi:MAG TPA: hypothetical protein VGF81_16745 [Solirubrobacteraceae bacterium]|jgi:hypothetical protein
MPGVLQRRLTTSSLAPVALMPAAAFAVHQLRYWLAYGGRAGAVLERQGHAYLHSLAPWLVLLLAIAAGLFLRALGRAFRGHCSARRYTASFVLLWAACAAALVAIFALQELLESAFATGHPAGVHGIFGYGGLWSIPASVCVGLVVAALLHGARWALHAVARIHAAPPAATRPTARPRAPRDVLLPRLAPVASGWSGRGPPG